MINLKIPDEPVLRCFDWVILRIQNTTGIPKWWIYSRLWLSYTAIGVVNIFFGGKSRVVSGITAITFGVWMLIMVFRALPAEKYVQESADRQQVIIPNRGRARITGFLVRVAMVLNAMLFFGFTSVLNVASGITLIMAMYLGFTHTFPMTGPTLKERLHSFFTLRKPAEELG